MPGVVNMLLLGLGHGDRTAENQGKYDGSAKIPQSARTLGHCAPDVKEAYPNHLGGSSRQGTSTRNGTFIL
jgi:hypothetical protein